MRIGLSSHSTFFAALLATCLLVMPACGILFPVSPNDEPSYPDDPADYHPLKQPVAAVKTAVAHKRHKHAATQTTAAASADPATPTPTLATFFGNLTAITAPVAQNVILQRLADCSLTYGAFTATGSGAGPFDITVTSEITGYEKVIHNNAFLTTTPDVFAKGCVDNYLGIGSQDMLSLGLGKNGRYLGAVYSASGIATASGTASPPALSNVTTYPTDIELFSIVNGDLNNDGNQDVVSINTNGLNSSVSVILGNADGTYKPAVNYDIPNLVVSFGVLDDLNGDGNLDLIINPGSNTFMIFLGNGDGTFQTPVTFSTGSEPLSFTDRFITADVNGDGKKDIVTSEGSVFFGQGNGTSYTFESVAFPRIVTASNALAPGMIAADFNNDKKLDLATDDGSTIRIFLGNGDGTFSAAGSYATIPNRGLIIGTDVDGDGNMDLISGYGGLGIYGGDDYLNNIAYALMGNGDGTFQGAPSLPFNYTGTNVLDLNGDGRPDLVGLISSATQTTLTTYLTGANGIPVAGPSLIIPSGVGVDSYALGAFDTNSNSTPGLIYLSAAPQTQYFYLALGTGVGNFGTPTEIPVPSLVPSGIDVNETITGVRAADFNHDGKLDIAYSFSDEDDTSQTYYQGFAVQLGNGDGTFQAPKISLTYQSATAPAVFPSNMLSAVYDVNKDNFPDVFMVVPTTITNAELQQEVLLFVGNGDGTFKAPNTITLTPNILPSTPDGSYGSPFVFADLNGDGKIDVVAAGSSSDGTTPQVAIALGNGDGTFQAPSILTFDGFGFAGTLALADFNGDGKIDMLVEGGAEALGNGIYPGNGDGTFQSISNGDGTVSSVDQIDLAVGNSAAAVDFNQDGSPDIIAGGVILINKSSAITPVLAPTSTALTSSLNPSTVGASVTLTATVTSTTAGTITGTATFFDGSTQIGTGTVGAGGVATLTTTTLAQGTHSITAQYGGDSNYSGSTSPAVSQVVNAAAGKATTSTALTSSLNPSTTGAAVTFTATVTSATAGTITGSVNFLDGATQIGTGTVGAGGVATLTTTTLAQGTQSITAQYSGDSNYATSTSPAVSQVVNASGKASTTTALVSSLNPSTVGAGVTFTATVTSSTAGSITGSVSFYDGAQLLDTPITMTGNIASYTDTNLAQGTHTITSVYSGNSSYATSTSTAVSQVVNASGKASTTVAIASIQNPSVYGYTVGFNITITSPTAGPITGTITLYDGTKSLGSGAVLPGNVSNIFTSTFNVGANSMTVQYSGDSNYAPSTSPALIQNVTIAPTTTALTASPTSGPAGTSVLFTATVTTGGALPLAGTMNFLDGATNIGSTNVAANGVTTFQTAILAAGTHSITAQYAGNADYSPSTSSAVQVTIAATGSFTLSANPASLTATKSTPGTTVITVTPANGFNQAVTFSCGNLTPTFGCTFSPTNVAPNGGPASTTLTVTYNPNAEATRAQRSATRLPAGSGGGDGGVFASSRKLALGALAGELALLVLLFTRRKKIVSHGALRFAYAILLCAIAVTFMSGCSGNGPSAQMTTITVNATGGTQTASTTLTVTTRN